MKNPSIVFTAPGQVEVLERPIPEPGSGEVLIHTRRSLISTGTELTLLSGQARERSVWASLSRYPQQVGYSNVGEVAALGQGVDPAWAGRRVETHSRHALWVTCHVDQLRSIPDEVSDEEAAFCSLAEVAMNGLRRVGLAWGESVAVFGLGILGQLAVRLCALAGAGPVFGIEPSGFRRGLMPRGPVFHVLDGHNDLEDRVRRLNAGRAVDIVIELTGRPEVIPREPLLLRDQGRFLLLSSPRDATLFDFHDLCNRRSLTIVGAHGFSHPSTETPSSPWTGRRHGELFLDRVGAGLLSVRELVSHRFPFVRAADAYRLLTQDRDQAMGVVFEWA